jgi:hypothetical protein
MALKALDQRMAGSNSQLATSLPPQPVPVRAPPAAALPASRSDSAVMPIVQSITTEQQDSGVEADTEDIAKPKEDGR